jgi:hypothetical protein
MLYNRGGREIFQAPPPGTEGTVVDADDIGNVLMRWDNGSGLNLIPDKDEFEIIG